MFRFNKFLTVLIGMAIAMLLVLGLYEIFLKPPEDIPSEDIQPINTYYGEDVLNFLNSKT